MITKCKFRQILLLEYDIYRRERIKEEEKFEQYKLFIESAEKNSDKRITQNNIYLTINLAFTSYISTQVLDLKHNIIMTIIGILICIVWLCTINNYAKRNKVKFEIINESEYGTLYKEEWKRISILTSLTTYEKISSIIFIILYIALFIVKLV